MTVIHRAFIVSRPSFVIQSRIHLPRRYTRLINLIEKLAGLILCGHQP